MAKEIADLERKLREQLEALGEQKVRVKLATGFYGDVGIVGAKRPLVEEWLRSKEQSRGAEQIEAASRAAAAADRAAAAAERQAVAAERANTRATIALIIAIISMVSAIVTPVIVSTYLPK